MAARSTVSAHAELRALRDLFRALSNLPARERPAALAGLCASLGLTEQPADDHPVARWVVEKQARTEADVVLVIATYLARAGQETFNTEDLRRIRMEAGLETFSNVSVPVTAVMKRGWVQRDPRRGFSLTNAGRAAFEAMPLHEISRR